MIMRKPYYVPEGIRITQYLLNLQNETRTFGLVVDEYGDFKGLVTPEEVLEEIVGEFISNIPGSIEDIQPQDDGSYLVKGSSNMRDLNRRMLWTLDTAAKRLKNAQRTDSATPGSAPRAGHQVAFGWISNRSVEDTRYGGGHCSHPTYNK